jgi:hypothetical protein
MSTIEARDQRWRRPASGQVEHHRLKARALGFPTVMAQSVALISPTMTAVLIIPICFADSGQGTWLAYAFGTVMLLFVVLCLNQFAKRSALPGSMYGYTAKGLGPKAGVMSGWSLIWCYLFIGVAGPDRLLDLRRAAGVVDGHPYDRPASDLLLPLGRGVLVRRLQGHQDLLAPDLVVRGGVGRLHLALACVILFKHGFRPTPRS